MSARPSFQFYPSDWRTDPELQSCSIGARGLWHEMLCVAHECEPYGELVTKGRPMTHAQIGRLTGVSEKQFRELYRELLDAGVPSEKEDGTIYSRRMVKDEKERGQWRDRQRDKRVRDGEGHDDVTEPITPKSRRSSSSTSSAEKKERSLRSRSSARKVPVPLPGGCPDQFDLEKACVFWRNHGREDLCTSVQDEVLAFRAHHTKFDNRFVDWSATWTTWYSKAIKFTKANGNGHQKSDSPDKLATFMRGAAAAIESFGDGAADWDDTRAASAHLPDDGLHRGSG